MVHTPVPPGATDIRDEAAARAYIQRICFKTGPPERIGLELEWTVHHRHDPTHPVTPAALRAALGAYTPPVLGGSTGPRGRRPYPTGPDLPPDHPSAPQPYPQLPPDHPSAPEPYPAAPAAPEPARLPGGAAVTAEPGGQLELSTLPQPSLTALYRAVRRDEQHLHDLLSRAGLALGPAALDRYRPPRRIVDTPRYAAMERVFDRIGPFGRQMMCGTAALQVCVDLGRPEQLATRWAAVHALGPPLLAAFANSRQEVTTGRSWASARMRCWMLLDPARTGTVEGADPVAAWVRYALTTPVLFVRRPGGHWDAPPGLTLQRWLATRQPRPLTTADVDDHLSTLFPWVRPRGYLELRWLDAQPPGEWIAPVAVLAALLADDRVTDAALDACAPAAGCWVSAARDGLASRAVAVAAADVLDLACRTLPGTGLPAGVRARVTEIVERRLAAGRKGA